MTTEAVGSCSFLTKTERFGNPSMTLADFTEFKLLTDFANSPSKARW